MILSRTYLEIMRQILIGLFCKILLLEYYYHAERRHVWQVEQVQIHGPGQIFSDLTATAWIWNLDNHPLNFYGPMCNQGWASIHRSLFANPVQSRPIVFSVDLSVGCTNWMMMWTHDRTIEILHRLTFTPNPPIEILRRLCTTSPLLNLPLPHERNKTDTYASGLL